MFSTKRVGLYKTILKVRRFCLPKCLSNIVSYADTINTHKPTGQCFTNYLKKDYLYVVDVLSYHGSMQLRTFDYQDEVLFNMINKMFPSLSSTEADLQTVFRDVIPALHTAVPAILEAFTYIDHIR